MLNSPDDASDWTLAFERDGFFVFPSVLETEAICQLIELTGDCSTEEGPGILDRKGDVYGIRDLLWRNPAIGELARSEAMLTLVRRVLGLGAFPVRGLFFDKTPRTNWNLPWHQDVTIAVKRRSDVAGFGPWTHKAGIPHVHAPGDLLARMVTLRLHLDPCCAHNGPMRVLPGSHSAGRLDAGAISHWMARRDELAVDCIVPAGGAVLMRPLILHASSLATAPGHRRVIHIEYAAELPADGLDWYAG